MGLLNVVGVVAGYSAADEILKGLDFSLGENEIVCVIGPNGAGKSTLLKAIAGLLRPSKGDILLKDRSIAGLPAREVSKLGLAYVPQEHNVFPNMSVAENLSTPGRAALAAPIFDHNNRIVAAVAVVGVQGRLELDAESRPARELAATARKLSQRLGAALDQIP